MTLEIAQLLISLTGRIAVYGVGDEFDGNLVRNTQSTLHSMAELSHALTSFVDTYFHGLISRASKMAIRLMLAHHHVSIASSCIIIKSFHPNL